MNDLLFYITISIAILTFIIATYNDHKKRSVNFLIFVPLMVISNIFIVVSTGNYIFPLFADIIWLLLFLNPEIWVFPLPIVFVLAVGIFLFKDSIIENINLIIVGLVGLSGTKEKLFGIGDLKGIIASILSFFPLSLTLGTYYRIQIPLVIFFVLNLGISASAALIWSFIYTKKVTGKMGYYVRYEGDVDRIRFREIERNGKKYVSYKIPFMGFILIAYILTVTAFIAGIPL